MSIETQLREALAARADEVGSRTHVPYERVSGAIAVSRRRRRGAALAAVAAMAAIAVAIPALGHSIGDRTTTPARHTAPVPGPSDPRWASLATWPIRGGLSGDADLVRAVGELGGGQVIFIDDIASRRVAFVVDPDQRQLALVEGDAGAPASRMDLTLKGDASDQFAGVFLTLTVDQSQTLILARPQVRTAEVSDHARVKLDGTVTREWRTVTLRDGMSRLPLGAVLLRTRISGYDRPPAFRIGHPVDGDDRGASHCGDCRGEAFRTSMDTFARDVVAMQLGIANEGIRTETVYAGPVDARVAAAVGLADALEPGSVVQLYVGHSHLSGGQVLRTAKLVRQVEDGFQGMELEMSTPLDARTAGTRPFVLAGGDGEAGKTGSTTLVQVFAGSGAAIRLVSDAPSSWPSSTVVPLAAGTARADLADVPYSAFLEHYQVEVRDTAGVLLGRYPVGTSTTADPFAGTP